MPKQEPSTAARRKAPGGRGHSPSTGKAVIELDVAMKQLNVVILTLGSTNWLYSPTLTAHPKPKGMIKPASDTDMEGLRFRRKRVKSTSSPITKRKRTRPIVARRFMKGRLAVFQGMDPVSVQVSGRSGIARTRGSNSRLVREDVLGETGDLTERCRSQQDSGQDLETHPRLRSPGA